MADMFTIVETVEYEVEASSAQEALELWLDKGDEAGAFMGVNERHVFDAEGFPCDNEVEDR